MKKGIINLLCIFLLISIAVSCDKDSTLGELTVYSVLINEVNFEEGMTNVPLQGTVEIAFSHNLNAEAFENSFSFSNSQGEASYEISFQNAGSKAIISYSDLNPATAYSLNLDPGPIGGNGESLGTNFTKEFTSSEEETETKTPCTSGNADCMEEIEISENSLFKFYSSYDIISDTEYIWENIEEVIFVVHGQNRNADEYFEYMSNAVGDMNRRENLLIISPVFKSESDAETDELFWSNNWREGGSSDNSATAISSFSVFDDLIEYLTNQDKFPNLQTINFAGHSSGAAMVQHYAFANISESNNPEYEFSYLVANNQYFYYPDDRRYNENTQEFFTPTDCDGFNNWPYGYNFSPSYLENMSQEDLLQQQISRNTIYLLGTDDTATEGTLNTSDCEANLLGSNRLERGRNIFRYFETFYPEHNHQKIEIENIGHDANAIFNSDEFKTLFVSN